MLREGLAELEKICGKGYNQGCQLLLSDACFRANRIFRAAQDLIYALLHRSAQMRVYVLFGQTIMSGVGPIYMLSASSLTVMKHAFVLQQRNEHNKLD